MKNKLLCVLGALVILTFTGCSNDAGNTIDTNSNDTKNVSEKTKGNCTLSECMNQISPENTVQEINDIIGIEGELTDEKYNEYYWELSDDEGIKVTYYSSDKGTIKADFEKSKIKNSKVKFTNNEELKTKVNSGITYEEFKNYTGGVDGVLVEKSSSSNKYIWVDND